MSDTPTPVVTETVDTSIPSKTTTRNEFGLINNGSVKYVYTPEGFVDWRAMINPKHLAVHKFNFERRGKPVPQSITGLDDKDLLILLPGIKELAQLRGFKSVSYTVTTPHPHYVVASCSIAWIPNFETENREIVFTAIGDASKENTTGFGKDFLGPIAENRAFVRAVRNFLKIEIMSKDEINDANPLASDSQTVDPALEALIKVMDENKVTFEQIKGKLVADKFENAEKFTELAHIPPAKRFELIGYIKGKFKKK
jgi:hypothetical protein